jgi:hypothetical protein
LARIAGDAVETVNDLADEIYHSHDDPENRPANQAI